MCLFSRRWRVKIFEHTRHINLEGSDSGRAGGSFSSCGFSGTSDINGFFIPWPPLINSTGTSGGRSSFKEETILVNMFSLIPLSYEFTLWDIICILVWSDGILLMSSLSVPEDDELDFFLLDVDLVFSFLLVTEDGDPGDRTPASKSKMLTGFKGLVLIPKTVWGVSDFTISSWVDVGKGSIIWFRHIGIFVWLASEASVTTGNSPERLMVPTSSCLLFRLK